MGHREVGEVDVIEQRLGELGIALPSAQPPVTTYRWAVRDNDVVHLAGHGPFIDGVAQYRGKVGTDVTLEEGYDANRLAGLTILRTLKEELGTLDAVVRPLWHVNYVNVADGYSEEFIQVGNGSTDLWSMVWGGEIAHCARITVGAAELPMGVPTAVMSSWKVSSASG